MIAISIESGEPITFPKERKGPKQWKRTLRLTPEQAIRNQAAWLKRITSEQNGGYHLVTAWDYQEER